MGDTGLRRDPDLAVPHSPSPQATLPQAEAGQRLAPAATSKRLDVLEPAYVPPKTQASDPGWKPSLESAGELR